MVSEVEAFPRYCQGMFNMASFRCPSSLIMYFEDDHFGVGLPDAVYRAAIHDAEKQGRSPRELLPITARRYGYRYDGSSDSYYSDV